MPANNKSDAFYNEYAFQRDGGDCCENTCISASYQCGRDESGYIHRGYQQCLRDDDMVAHKQPVNSSLASLSANGAVLASADYDYYGNSVRILSGRVPVEPER